MIEANENIDLVTARRAADLDASLREGAAVRSATLSVDAAPAVVTDAVPAFSPPAGTAAHESVAASVPGAASLPAADGRMRLGITAGLAVLLFVAWFWQRASSRR